MVMTLLCDTSRMFSWCWFLFLCLALAWMFRSPLVGNDSQGKVDMSCETKEDRDLMVVCTQPG
jgi:hypothetical protein